MDKEKQMNTLMVEAVMKALKRANIPVYKAADDLAVLFQINDGLVEFSKKKTSVTALPEENSSFKGTAVPIIIISLPFQICKAKLSRKNERIII